MADAPDPVTSAPPLDFQPWDATADPGPVSQWEKLPGGAVDIATGRLTGEDFPDAGPWKQC